MSTSEENHRAFFELLESAIDTGAWVKATLSRPSQAGRWKRVYLAPFINADGTPHVALEYDDGRQTERKNIPADDAFNMLQGLIPNEFRSVHLKTVEEELLFELTDKQTYRLKRTSAPQGNSGAATHNREKNYIVPANRPFLKALGITGSDHRVRREMYDKFRQINRFIETVSDLTRPESLAGRQKFHAVDFGSGKNYLTFALYDFLSRHNPNIQVVGVEQRPELVNAGNELRTELGWNNLRFEAGTIAEYPLQSVDLVVALHACDTATDDALYKAITAEVEIICVAPCCHKYVRSHFSSSADLEPLLRHGIIAERFTEGLTDSLRVLALEASGYSAKLFEFISLEHTAKNVMVTARRTSRGHKGRIEALRSLREKFALSDFYLDRLLNLQ
jgi:hypothetical protein